MSDFMNELFHTTKVKDFVALFKEAEEKYKDPQKFLSDITTYLPLRLYEHYYGDTVPHSLFGLLSAHQTQSFLPEEQRWRPFAQQCWFATQEQKRTPLNLETNGTKIQGNLDERWQYFQAATNEENFADAMASAQSFLKNDQDRTFFRQKSLTLAMKDTSYGGQKLSYLFHAWRVAEALQWNHTEKILAPALHLIVIGPKDHSLSQLVQESCGQTPLSFFSEQQGQLSTNNYEEIESLLLFSNDTEECLSQFEILANSGAGLAPILLAAAQGLSNSANGQWIWPMRAFHFCYVIEQWAELDLEKKGYAMAIAASLVNQASNRSRVSNQNCNLNEVAQQLSPVEPFEVLRRVISHTDPHAAATAVYAILGMKEDKTEELFQTLLSQAIKNDGQICYGNDILYISEALDCYRRFNLQQKEKLPVSAGYFLGRIKKGYELAGAYGVQKNK